MQYPRIVKSPNLSRVFASWKEGGTQCWQERVNEVFGMTISVSVGNISAPDIHTCSINPLEWQVLEELSNMLRCSRSTWKFWTVELVEKAIPKLVKACIWKNEVLSEQSYYRDIVNRYAEEGFEILTGLPDYFTLYSRDGKPSTRRHLVRKYLEGPYIDGDARAILVRALRCLVTYRISRKPKSELIFKFCPDLTLSLWGRVINKYLYEQVCLYIYLFKNAEEAHFFLERRQQLINFVSARLPRDHEDLAEAIVGETFEYLIKRRNCYSETPDGIWIDTSLDTYFIGNILSSKRIQRFWEKKRRLEGCGCPESSTENDYTDEYSISARPKTVDMTGPHHLPPSNSEKDRLLRHYLNKLDPTCKSYFYWEFLGKAPAGQSELDARHLSAIEKPCFKKIKNLLVESGYYDLFIK